MNKTQRKFELYSRLQSLGFTFGEAVALRRIEMTLQRWAEQECGDGNDFSSWSIERDELTDKPYRCVYPHDGAMKRYPIADREKGALKRLHSIVVARNIRENAPIGSPAQVVTFHQTDPRGCALYLIKACDVPAGAKLDSCYNRGLAICA